MTRAKSPSYRVYYRRRRSGKTNFVKRLALMKSGKTRMVVRRSNKNVVVQFVAFDPKGDKTLVTVNGAQLAKKYKWPSKRNVWTAYLAGLEAAKLAKKQGVSDFVLDIGLYVPSKGSVLFAALAGANDAGLKSDFDDSIIPSDKLSNPPEKIKGLFEEVKGKIGTG